MYVRYYDKHMFYLLVTAVGVVGCDMNRADVSKEVLDELQQVFTAELAHRAYIQCCRLAGGHYIQKLANDDLIRRLCTDYELELKDRCKRLGNLLFILMNRLEFMLYMLYERAKSTMHDDIIAAIPRSLPAKLGRG